MGLQVRVLAALPEDWGWIPSIPAPRDPPYLAYKFISTHSIHTDTYVA